MAGLTRRILPQTLFGRSLMILALPMLLLQLMAGFFFLDRHWGSVTEKLAFAVAGEVRLISDALAAERTPAGRARIAEMAKNSLGMEVVLESSIGPALPQRKPQFARLRWLSADVKLHAALSHKLARPFALRPHREEDRRFEIVVDLDEKTRARFLCHDRRLTSATTYVFLLWLVGGAALLFAIALVFMRNQIRPIRRLAVVAEKLGKGQDVPDFKPVGASEVRQASRAFLQMKDRLKRQIEQRTAMLAGVSHDLRTPLTRMKLQMAMMGRGDDVENLRQDVDEMEKMIEAYLSFARGDGNEAVEMTDLSAVLERIVSNARRQGADIALEQEEGGRAMLRLRPVAVERALANVVGNACKYAGHVWVALRTGPEAVEVIVDDDGPGIPPELREDVFRPFYRVEKSRNRKTGGIGLGLSIAQDIVHGHGGEISLENSRRGGLRVLVRLPV